MSSASHPWAVSGLLLVLLCGACRHTPDVGSGAAASAGPADAALARLASETDAWHAERLERLTAPDGWLSLVALAWLEPGRNRIGSAPDAEVSYAGLPGEHVGTLVLDKRGVQFEPVDGFDVAGVPADGRLRTDADGDPTVLALGDVRFHVVVRGGRPAVRMKDASAPTRLDFAGIERFDVDPHLRIRAEFTPAEAGETIGLDTVIGVPTEAAIRGRARFLHAGHPVDAVLFASGDGALLRFADTTNGEATYSAGRYLHVEPPEPAPGSSTGQAVVLDFNRAYNPPCAFTPFATCSIPPPPNRLPFAVTAGERW